MKQRLELLHNYFRRGEHQYAIHLLTEMVRGRMPRERRIECANLARRAGNPQLALRVLHPVVRGRSSQANGEELAEYATSLAMLGHLSESNRVFQRVNFEAHPGTLYLRAVSRMARWEFGPAREDLERYLPLAKNDGAAAAARLRVAACILRGGDHPSQAGKLIEEGLRATRDPKSIPQHVYGRTLHIEYLYFVQNDAVRAIAEAESIEKEFPEYDLSVPRFWKILLQLKSRGEVAELRGKLAAEREGARARRNWHLLRLQDTLEALVLKSRDCHRKVFFGSPLPGLRAYLKHRLGPAAADGDGYEWTFPGATDRSSATVLDVARGSHSSGRGLLRHESVRHKLLSALSSDFYAPLAEGFLHETLFPEHVYDPNTTTSRIRVEVSRLRNWFEEEGLAIDIECDESAYRLVPTAQPSRIVLHVPHPEGPALPAVPAAIEREVSALSSKFGNEPFSAAEAAELWGIPLRSAQLRLKQAKDLGVLDSSGRARACRYTVKVS